VTVPLYQGGAASARVRQAKEQLGQQRILVDSVRAGQSSSRWCLRGRRWKRRGLTIEANRAQLSAANLALNGVVEERRVGQRTTLDVLNAQQSVLNAKEAISQSERNAIVASFSVLGLHGEADRWTGLALACRQLPARGSLRSDQGPVVRAAHRRRPLSQSRCSKRMAGLCDGPAGNSCA
jgi:hypothetical protein